MKKIGIVAILLSVLLLESCSGGKQIETVSKTYSSATETTRPTKTSYSSATETTRPVKTSSGTPINYEFDISSVSMISTPGSTCFSQIGYSSYHRILVVTFRDSGATYIYRDVPGSVWSDLRDADSMGGYYNASIKGQYSCEKVG